MKISITKSKIVGISSAVPKNKFNNENYNYLNNVKLDKFIKLTGIYSRRISKGKICTSDLAVAAGEQLLKDLRWEKNDIEFIILITQTADYLTPATSIIIQDRLKLKKELFALDINLGCSGLPYGISIANSLVDNLNFSKGILFIGDVSSRLCNMRDSSTWPIFGDACSAIAFEKKDRQKLFFDFYSDGSKYHDIIVPAHSLAGKNQLNIESLKENDIGELKRNELNMHLNGANVFSFAISQVPSKIHDIIKFSKIKKNKIKYCFLHQANNSINQFIKQKLKLNKTKFPESLKNFGNTSSASITMSITQNFSNQTLSGNSILCGFGVGLSLSTALITFDKCKVSKLVEIIE